jgi:glycine oxidase
MNELSRSSNPCVAPDIVVVGAGLIGLAIALELHGRGAAVTVIERGYSLGGASAAAAGMLAVEDPNNSPELRALSRMSAELYPTFLNRIEELSGVAVPFQTEMTVQYLADGTAMRLAERSLDPRQLAAALLRAVEATSIRVLEQTRIAAMQEAGGGITVRTTNGAEVAAGAIVYAAGAWMGEVMTELHGDAIPMAPCKGQMLRVWLPAALELTEVHRSERIYIVPRTRGPQAGTALIGATVEDAGFDMTVRAEDLGRLRGLAAELLPELGTESEAPMVEAWAGLRPVTPDALPCIGAWRGSRQFVVGGHYRNGILQAPGTAVVIADLIEGKESPIDISGLSPDRFFAAARVTGKSSAQSDRYSPSSK